MKPIREYWKLKKTLNWPTKASSFEIRCKDLFLVTSCTNPFDSKIYSTYNNKQDQWQRAEELMNTFNSIRAFYPDSKIINLENSKIDERLRSQITSECEQWLDYSDDNGILYSRTFANKGVPWIAKLIKFLDEENMSLTPERLHILAGRYALTRRAIAATASPGAYFRYYPEHNNVSTRYICYSGISALQISKSLKLTILPMVSSVSIEDVIHTKGRFAKHFLSNIGIRGRVNGSALINE